MVQIGDKIVSLDIFEKKFVCNFAACRGACCVQGDSGAPLSAEETGILDKEYPGFAEMLSPSGRATVERHGKWHIDPDGDYVTPLIQGKECAYTVFRNGMALCSIELAWTGGKTGFRKPLSCHLYPIRVTKIGHHYALNFHSWSVCQPALKEGQSLGTPVYRFLKESIIRAFGEDFYREMEQVSFNLAGR